MTNTGPRMRVKLSTNQKAGCNIIIINSVIVVGIDIINSVIVIIIIIVYLDEGVEDIVRADLALAGDEVAVVEQAVEGDAEDLEAESDERPESTNGHGGRQEAKLTLRRFSRIDHFLRKKDL